MTSNYFGKEFYFSFQQLLFYSSFYLSKMKLTEKNNFKNFNFNEFQIEGIEGCFYINNLVYDTWCDYYPDEANGDYTCHVQMVDYDISYQDDDDNLIKVELTKEFVECNLTNEIEETIDWHTFIQDNYEK